MKKSGIIYLLVASLLLSACASNKQKQRTITISGAFALYPLVITWAEKYKEENPRVRFNVSGGGAGKGMADALAGAVDLGMVSRSIAPEEIGKGAWSVGLTIDAVVPTVSDRNPHLKQILMQGLTREEFTAIFLTESITTWNQLLGIPGNDRIVVYNRADACGAAETWANYLGGKQENIKGVGIFGDPGLAEAVANDPLGIGFNNTIFAYDIKTGKKRSGVEVVPIDLNGNGQIDSTESFYDSLDHILKAISDGSYPSPPARELYFVSKGKPEKKATTNFIRWCLTEGQKYVREAGYVPLNQNKIDQYLKLLD
jgi:phosphate transport system substrate-binding protein